MPTAASDACFFSPTPLQAPDVDVVELAQRDRRPLAHRCDSSLTRRRTGTGTAAGPPAAPRPATSSRGDRRATPRSPRSSPASAPVAGDDRDQLARPRSSSRSIEQRRRRLFDTMPPTATMPSPRTSADPVARRDRSGRSTVRVAHRLRDLAGRDRVRRIGHLGRVLRRQAASGSYTTSAASASGIDRVGTTTTVFVVSASTCSATGMMFLLLGRITTWSALTCSTVSSSSAVDGFIVWPPVTTPCTPSWANSSTRPSPQHTATTAVVTGGRPPPARLARGPGHRRLALGVLLVDLLEQIGDPDLRGRPSRSSATSIAAPTSLVWTWQFHSPSPPTTTIESPIVAPTAA